MRSCARLHAFLAALHNKGIAHNDLSKAENILVRPDGSPVLIDLQIASSFRIRFPLLGWLGRQALPYMQAMDRYHVGKHHRRDRPEDFTAAELAASRRKGLLLQLHGWLLRRPYRAVRHFVLNRFMREGGPTSLQENRDSAQAKRAA